MRGVGYAILYSIDLKDDVLLYKVNVERYITTTRPCYNNII